MKTFYLISVFALFSACTTPALNPAATNVKIMKSDPPAGCQDLGGVDSVGEMTEKTGAEFARIRIRNKAAEKGANYVRIDAATNDTLSGTMYKCP